MSPGLIVYKSKYGATEKYAGWLSQETGFDCVDVKHFSAADLDNYETVIFGSGIYASHISGLSFSSQTLGKAAGKGSCCFLCRSISL